VVSTLDLPQLFHTIASGLRRVMHHEYTSLALFDPRDPKTPNRRARFSRGQRFDARRNHGGTKRNAGGPGVFEPLSTAIRPRGPGALQLGYLPPASRRGSTVGLLRPAGYAQRVLGTLNVASLRDSAFSQEDADLLSQVAAQVAIAVENALAFEEIAQLKNKLADEKLYLEDEIRTEYNFEEIVGRECRLEGPAQAGPDRCAHGLDRADRRRDRHRQGTDCPRDP